jgi:hypothetical protein
MRDNVHLHSNRIEFGGNNWPHRRNDDPPQLARLGLGGLPGAGMKLGLRDRGYSYPPFLSGIW